MERLKGFSQRPQRVGGKCYLDLGPSPPPPNGGFSFRADEQRGEMEEKSRAKRGEARRDGNTGTPGDRGKGKKKKEETLSGEREKKGGQREGYRRSR